MNKISCKIYVAMRIFLSVFFVPMSIFSQIEIERNISIDDGLAYSQVNCAYKDYRGIMWLGTANGLSEWNSVNFKNYYKSDGLPSNYITSLCETETNLLFIGTKKGLVLRKGNKFVKSGIPDSLNSEIITIFKTLKGNLYILTKESGIWLWNNKGFKLKEFENNSEKIYPTSITEKPDGEILIGTRSNGIYRLVNNKFKQFSKRKIYKKYPIVDLLQVEENLLFVALMDFGIVIEDEEHTDILQYITTKNGLPNNRINDLSLSKNGELYVSTPDGIAVLKDGVIIKSIKSENGLTNEFILKTFFFNSETIFFLSNGNGIYIYRNGHFLTYNKNSGLAHNNVWAIKELNDRGFCFLTDAGVSILRKNKFSVMNKSFGLGDDLVLSVYENTKGGLFLGTFLDGVNLINKGKVTRINQRYGMIPNSVWSIQERDNGNLLFVTHKGGIAEYNGHKIIDTLGLEAGLPNNRISSSLKRRNGSILVGVEDYGIYEVVGNKFLPYLNGISDMVIWAMYEDDDENLYIGTDEKGIIRISEDNKRDTINISSGLSDNTVVAITGDDLGNIYAATDHGLNVIRYLDNNIFRVKKIFKQSGLASSECNQGAIYKDKKGNIWVGTTGGVTRIDPLQIQNSESSLPIFISSIKIFNQEFKPLAKFNNTIFNYNENDFTFSFVGLNYSNSGIENYKYKLSGIDENWIFDKHNKVRYANLPKGDYKFSVSASNDWGIWTEPKSVSFSILSPFWNTWWFIIISIIIFLTIIYLLVNYRIKSLLRLEMLRAKISADLHDEIGSGLSEISILSELLKLNSPSLDQNLISGLDKIGDSTRELIEGLSDIIWIVNPHKETLKDLILRIQDSYLEIFSYSDISFSVRKVELLDNLKLPLEIKKNLYLILKEAVNNSLKYSKCKNILINFNKRNQKLLVEISDDGIGIKDDDFDKGNGLFNMKKRCETMNAKIVFDSTSNGTKIRIEVPIMGK